MPLKPINLIYCGDLYRFFIDVSKAPEISLSHTEKFEDCMTHSERVEWEAVPLILKEMLIEKVEKL